MVHKIQYSCFTAEVLLVGTLMRSSKLALFDMIIDLQDGAFLSYFGGKAKITDWSVRWEDQVQANFFQQGHHYSQFPLIEKPGIDKRFILTEGPECQYAVLQDLMVMGQL